MCCTCRLGQPPPSQLGTLLYFQLRARFGGPPWWAIMPPLTSKRAASRPIPILAARPSLRPRRNAARQAACSNRSAPLGTKSASMATTSGHPNRSNRRFRPCEICAPRSSMPSTPELRVINSSADQFLGQLARPQRPAFVDLVRILAGKRSAADRHARPVVVDN